MTFLNPILLGVGGACVAIPIVIHLLMRRRRRPVRWAAMQFLLEAYKQRRRRVQLEHLLLLVARCLLVALIALAVARPIMGGREGAAGGTREVYLLVDNSLASALQGDGGESELARSVASAAELLNGLDSARGDRAALITLGGPARAVVSPATGDLTLIERRLAELRPTDGPMDLAGGLALIPTRTEGDEAGATTAAVFSAFREGSVGRAPPLAAPGEGVELRAESPARAVSANTGLSAFSLLRPVVIAGDGELVGSSGQARVGLIRSGLGVDQAALTTVRVLAEPDGPPREVGQAVVRWTPGQAEAHTTVDIDLTGLGASGGVVLRAAIDRDANERDNSAWAVLDVRESLRVVIVGTRRFGGRPGLADFGPSDWLRLALEPVAGAGAGDGQVDVEVVDAARVDPGSLAGFDAAIVAEPGRVRPEGWEVLGAFRARGGAVLMAVSPVPGAQLWTEQAVAALGVGWVFEREPAELDEADRGLVAPAVDGDDLLWFVRSELGALAETVSVERVLPVDPGEGSRGLLAAADGTPVLIASVADPASPREGQAVLLTTAVDLDWTDLPARPLMVPLIQELVRSSVGRGSAHASAGAGSRVVAPSGAIEVADRSGGAEGIVTVDPSTGLTREPVRLAGAYLARDPAGVVVGALAIQPDADAGRAGVVEADRVAAWLSAASGPDRFAWSDTDTTPAAGTRSAEDPHAPGPGLVLLAAALAIACVELGLARLVSHASRAGGAA